MVSRLQALETLPSLLALSGLDARKQGRAIFANLIWRRHHIIMVGSKTSHAVSRNRELNKKFQTRKIVAGGLYLPALPSFSLSKVIYNVYLCSFLTCMCFSCLNKIRIPPSDLDSFPTASEKEFTSKHGGHKHT